MSARSLLDKVRELEAVGQNPMLRRIGSPERFKQIMSAPPASEVDTRVGGFLVACVSRWINGGDNEPIPPEFEV